MFDLNCLQSYRTFFAEEQVVERGGRRLVWRGQGTGDAQPGTLGEARFEVEPGGEDNGAGGGEEREVETHIHRQRHFPEAEVRDALERAGLECLDVYGHGHDAVPKQPVEELVHSKAVYIAGRA
jgi:hypothetical protein